jgi:hypothetical protein
MDRPGGREEDVAGTEYTRLLAEDEISAALQDDVDLVSRVRLLRVVAAGRLDLNFERAVGEDRREALARGRGDSRERRLGRDVPSVESHGLSPPSFAMIPRRSPGGGCFPSPIGIGFASRSAVAPGGGTVAKTVLIFVLLGAILGAVAASLVVPPALGWYNEAGFLAQDGKVQALVNLPQVIKYTTDRLLKAQAIGAGLGAVTFLILGSYSASRGRRRPQPAAAPANRPTA